MLETKQGTKLPNGVYQSSEVRQTPSCTEKDVPWGQGVAQARLEVGPEAGGPWVL